MGARACVRLCASEGYGRCETFASVVVVPTVVGALGAPGASAEEEAKASWN